MLFKKSKNAIVIGCSRLGANMAGTLCQEGYHTVIVDKDSSAFQKLTEQFNGIEIKGDATDIATLEKVGIKEADMLIACTQSDNVNSLICQIADRICNIPHVFMCLDDPEKEKLIDDFNIIPIEPFALSLAEFDRLTHSLSTAIAN